MEARRSGTPAGTGGQAVTVSNLGYLSRDGKSQIRALMWEPAKKGAKRSAIAPRAIVQIVHGMSEHIERYDGFARHLVGHGFVVCANDHIGHGKSAASASELGCLPVRGGKEALVGDVHELHKLVAARFARQTPYIMLGHSMGSFIARAYMARHGGDLSAVVLSGTGQQPLLLSKAGHFLACRIAASKGAGYCSPLLHTMGAGAFAKKIPDARTPFDWISADPQVVDAYIADGLCGFMFSAGGYATLTDLTGEIVGRACAAKVPKELPVLFVSGALDPVGGCGTGVARAAEQLRSAGVGRVDMRLYEGMRHEILNEQDRSLVYADITAWVEERIGEDPA